MASSCSSSIAGSGRVGDLHHEFGALQRKMSDPDKAGDMDRILDRFRQKTLNLLIYKYFTAKFLFLKDLAFFTR